MSNLKDHRKQYHWGERIRIYRYPNEWEDYKQKLIKKEETVNTNNTKTTNCECKKEIKELKEVVKVLTTKGYI